jgi:hypothetical protein
MLSHMRGRSVGRAARHCPAPKAAAMRANCHTSTPGLASAGRAVEPAWSPGSVRVRSDGLSAWWQFFG